MKRTLEVTNVLSDQTRLYIYNYIIETNRAVTVKEMSEYAGVHVNVARLHLAKLESASLIKSYTKNNGLGGRPSRYYVLAEEPIEISFPTRDFKLLSTISLNAISRMGEVGKDVLYSVGKEYGRKMLDKTSHRQILNSNTNELKVKIIEEASIAMGLYSTFKYNDSNKTISFEINNCPFKELVSLDQSMVCNLHREFLNGMLESLFTSVKLVEKTNMFQGCETCNYEATIMTN